MKNRKDLVETSNEYHEAICDYIEEKGFDELVKAEMEMKIKWLQLMAKRNGHNLYIDIE
ncbi:hypothetical protein [Oceanobacillus kimchii]|uniref:Uncharacterized protein n=1 Tax=Oceanobacillus kimchii TaxID=746691 RepID=A0ABQ5TIE2_9BACI|nr:hypothetical protein [Oceanobacillus kimchii]GLO66230.1 hypothetical protein MACH08_20140 [Oceanobacillus kimchii]